MKNWTSLFNKEDAGYNIFRLSKDDSGMDLLKETFPNGKADNLNMVLFSTSGTHGTYRTIEEEEKEPGYGITFLIIKPRLVSMNYGTVYPKTPEDFKFLYNLRKSSSQEFANQSK